MLNYQKLLLIAIASGVLASCKPGFNQTYYDNTTNGATTTPACNPGPADAAANAQAKKVLRLVATLSCENKAQFNRVMAGQHLGTVDDLNNKGSYTNFFSAFATNGTTPAILSVEYAYTENFSVAQLKQANETLKKHWNKNGLVSISWMPKNPWQSSFSTAYSDTVNLEDLYKNADNEYYKNWHTQLDEIAEALIDLQNQNVAVLWRPLPAMNSDNVWWGSKATTGNGTEAQYEELWKNMFTYLHNNKGLHNLVWVFAPMDTTLATSNKPINWGLPESYVDIVAPIARNKDFNIRDYQDMINTGKPLALSELSPDYSASAGSDKQKFDTGLYKTKLTDAYPFIAYWVSWNDETIDDTVYYLSLQSNKNAIMLLQNSSVITTEKITRDQLFNFAN